LVIAGLYGLVVSCSEVPLLAPTGSKISLLPEANSVSLNSQIQIVATVFENGIATSGGNGSGVTTGNVSGSGTPVQNGTQVTFTTSTGNIQPSQAYTTNGQVTVTFVAGSTSGTATITAYSGGTSATITLPVGTAAVKTVNLSVSPQALPATGGNANVVASVTDTGGAPLGGVPVSFITDHGTVNPATINTDSNGNATAVLSTTATAKITATAGTVTSTAQTVTVNARGLSNFTATPASTTAGTPVTFNVTPTTGVNISNVHVDFGDGSAIDLGAISAASSTSHAYSSAGIYTATATASDSTGNIGQLSTQVIVGALQVTLAAAPNPTTTDTPTTLTVSGTSTAAVDHFQWSWDDGTASFPTSAPQVTHSWSQRGTKTVRVDVYGVTGGLIGTATTQITVQ
jgi:PKD repeat protein